MEQEQEPQVTKKSISHTRKTSKWWEVFRFVVDGVICTAIDYLCQIAVFSLFKASQENANFWSWPTATAFTVGFLVSTIANYFISTYWVFQNVDQKANAKSQKAWWLFFVFGLGGFFIGLGIQLLGGYVCLSAWMVDITEVKFSNLFTQGAKPFWAFTAVFIIKTLFTLVYNYITRKLFIYKAPKEKAFLDKKD
jgi:putative flippase GtrA